MNYSDAHNSSFRSDQSLFRRLITHQAYNTVGKRQPVDRMGKKSIIGLIN